MNHTRTDVDFLLFGATGDLAMRKIFPSLYEAYAKRLLPTHIRIIATGRSALNIDSFISLLHEKAKTHITSCDESIWKRFLTHIHYISINTQQRDDFLALEQLVGDKQKDIVIYFSIAPTFFISVCENLARIGLNQQRTRIILEKPLGVDLRSCKEINDAVATYYNEDQIYRIDHYLGKHSVQNLLVLRAYNPLFCALWNKEMIDHIQITVFETLGVENRGEFYDKTGAVRDMVQNHILQILSLLAMEIPTHMNAANIRQAKCKILRTLRIPDDKEAYIIRAQYAQSKGHKAYIDEPNIAPHSKTESFFACKIELDDERWKGVPFYIRTGKKMAESFAQIVVVFGKDAQFANKLIIDLQPINQIHLTIAVKKSGKTMEYEEKSLHFTQFDEGLKPYESLILDALHADATSFNHKEELEMAWTWADGILEYFNLPSTPLYHYEAGSFGPKEAFALMEQDGRAWL